MPTARSYSSTARRTSTNRTRNTRGTSTTKTTSQKWPSTKYSSVRNDIQWRIGSYRNIYSQVKGPGQVTNFSPRTATQWYKYVNNGVMVYKFNSTQFGKYFGTQFNQGWTPTTATRFFKQKFGRNIKAVAKGTGTTWLVAATGTINKGPFKNYTWK